MYQISIIESKFDYRNTKWRENIDFHCPAQTPSNPYFRTLLEGFLGLCYKYPLLLSRIIISFFFIYANKECEKIEIDMGLECSKISDIGNHLNFLENFTLLINSITLWVYVRVIQKILCYMDKRDCISKPRHVSCVCI